jgi:cobalamin biosynthesis protein CobT
VATRKPAAKAATTTRRTPATKRAGATTRKPAAIKTAAPARTARKAAAKAPAPKPAAKRDVTQYADKPASDYHKAYAKWIVTDVGYDPNSAASKRAAFLAGVSIATAARSAFMESDYLEDWRADNGIAKRGPKPKDDADSRRRSNRQDVSDDEFEDDSDEDFEDDDEEADEDDDDEFEDDSDEDDDESDDDEDDDEDEEGDEDEFEDDDEEEEEPAPKRRGRPASSAVKTGTRGSTRGTKAKPAATAKGRRTATAKDDKEFLF